MHVQPDELGEADLGSRRMRVAEAVAIVEVVMMVVTSVVRTWMFAV